MQTVVNNKNTKKKQIIKELKKMNKKLELQHNENQQFKDGVQLNNVEDNHVGILDSLENETTQKVGKLLEKISGKIEDLRNNIDLTKDRVLHNSGLIGEEKPMRLGQYNKTVRNNL